MKTYADTCLERAEKATLKNQLAKAYKYQPSDNKHGHDLFAVSWDGRYRLVERVREDLADDVVKTWEFFIDARRDVPELARRLKKAIEALKDLGEQTQNYNSKESLNDWIYNELEFIP